MRPLGMGKGPWIEVDTGRGIDLVKTPSSSVDRGWWRTKLRRWMQRDRCACSNVLMESWCGMRSNHYDGGVVNHTRGRCWVSPSMCSRCGCETVECAGCGAVRGHAPHDSR